MTIEKRFDPGKAEKKWYDYWIRKGYFKAGARDESPAYCIVIPPPNVTGSLHI
jgi:valyl-tRNA synthetase